MLGWINYNTINSTSGILLMKNTDYGMRLNSGGINPYFITTNNAWGGKGSYSMAGCGGLQTGKWYFVGFSYANGSMNVYCNGLSVGSSAAYTGALNGTNNSNMYIGNTQWDNSYTTGFEDNIRIYNRALSTSEIQSIYNNEK